MILSSHEYIKKSEREKQHYLYPISLYIYMYIFSFMMNITLKVIELTHKYTHNYINIQVED